MTDAAALAQFEEIVLRQKPASAPWQPVTDYSAEARDVIEGPHAAIIADTFAPSLVYDVGCGPGHLDRLLRARWISVRAFDVVPTGDALYGDIVLGIKAEPAELVICREVLEHLTVQHIVQAVRHLCQISSRYVYLTTRFKADAAHLLDLDTSDDLDPTHISITNQTWLRHLFVLEGFKRRPDLEERLDWLKKNRVLVYERV